MTPTAELLHKYYVQSEQHRWILLAPDHDGAALRFAQLVLRSAVRNQRRLSPTVTLVDEDKLEEKLETFGEMVWVSESGFEGERTGIFATSEVIQRWREQMKSLETMLRKMK